MRRQLVITSLIGSSLAILACSGGEKGAPVSTAPTPAAAPTTQAVAAGSQARVAEACTEVAEAGAAQIKATRDFIASLDELRAAAFQPSFELPSVPREPDEKPCETRFASAPAKDEFKRAQNAYRAAVKKVERDLARYTSEFNKNWSRLELGDKAKPSELLTAAAARGPLPRDASCHVREVEGRCRRVCRYDRGDGVTREDSRACLPQYDMGWWVVACTAELVCAVDPALESTRAGIAYSAEAFRIRYSKSYKAKDEATAADEFQTRMGSIGYGVVVRVPAIDAWSFRQNGWVGEARVEDGWPTVATANGPCCEEKVAAAKARRAAVVAVADESPDDSGEPTER